jgi:hypothetical protein
MVKRGKMRRGTQRYLWQNMAGAKGSVLLAYRNRGGLPAGKHTSIGMRLKASGGRDTARVLGSRTDTILRALQTQEAALEAVHPALRRPLRPAEVTGASERAGEAERDGPVELGREKERPAVAVACEPSGASHSASIAPTEGPLGAIAHRHALPHALRL